MLAQAGTGTEMEHDLVWLAGLADDSRMVTPFVLTDGRCIEGFAPFWVHPATLDYRLGEVTLGSFHVTRYVLPVQPILALSAPDATRCVLELFALIRRELPGRGVIFLQGVPRRSALFPLLAARSPLHDEYHVLRNGPLYERRLIRLDGAYDEYLSKLGSGTRKDLRHTRKHVMAAYPDARTRCFSGPDDVAPFLRDAGDVSGKTYQRHLLGQGVAQTPFWEQRLGCAAKLGYFQSYVLYLAGQPVAFQLGYRHRGTYFAHECGYDPRFAKLQVGIHLFTEIILDLTKLREPDLTFDFLSGDSLYKQRLSTESRTEQHFYLIPRRFPVNLVALSVAGMNAASEAAGRLLARYGLNDRFKKMIRRRASGEPGRSRSEGSTAGPDGRSSPS
ncbi:MAG: GNAT family N-acetyltransferase [Burkholderiales bacterium]